MMRARWSRPVRVDARDLRAGDLFVSDDCEAGAEAWSAEPGRLLEEVDVPAFGGHVHLVFADTPAVPWRLGAHPIEQDARLRSSCPVVARLRVG